MAGELFERLSRSAQNAAIRLNVRSGLNPALWMVGIASPICFTAALAFQEPTLRLALVTGGLVPIVVACIGFLFFVFWRPDKLQSEEYQLRQQSLQIIQEKSGRIAVTQADITAISNPLLPQITEPGQ